MRWSVGVAFLAPVLLIAYALPAQVQPPSEKLIITAAHASTREQDGGSIIEAEGNVTLEVDRATLSADGAVIWLSDVPADQTQRAQIALIGHAKVEQKSSVRSGDRLLVTAPIRGTIRLTTVRVPAPESPSPLYQQALALRDTPEAPNVAEAPAVSQPVPGPAEPTTAPASSAPAAMADTKPPEPRADQPPTASPEPPSSSLIEPANAEPIPPATSVPRPSRPGERAVVVPTATTQPALTFFEADRIETVSSSQGKVAVVLSGGVKLFQRRPAGDSIELQAERTVLFTSLKSLREVAAGEQRRKLQESVLAAYLEGDVRIVYTAATYQGGEQRLTADRVYYEFATDRAILTDAIVHTVDPRRQIPFTLRAQLVRQLSAGEFSANKAQLSTSSFALPSLAIAADRMYVRSDAVSGPVPEQEVSFKADQATIPAFGVPIFYWPSVSGTVNDDPEPLRGFSLDNRSSYGVSAQTEWGLFESLGVRSPRDLDAAYRVDYFSERGPALGLASAYQGGFVSEESKLPWSFAGDFKGYFVDDRGEDDFGRQQARVNAHETIRGRAIYEHMHYFPDDWELQLRAGWVSDATFRENWFRREYEEDLPLDVSAYVKRQRDTEAFTMLLDFQPSKVVTNSDLAQEQFEVERYPQIGYRRIGDSVLDDHLTVFSDNTGDALHFQKSRATLRSQGYAPPYITPGLPALGQTGTTSATVFRGNLRQEADYPFTLGPMRVVPYTEGILTQYSDSPVGGEKTRLLIGGGARISAEFWKVDPAAESDLLDIHQLRHVVTPQINLFSAAQNIRHNEVFIYDEPIDSVSDINAVQVALRQKWETKRGGPGQWRSVDAFTFNVDLDLFAKRPPPAFLNPVNFRGLYFPSLPEASIPRNGINADASWRISDETVVIAETSYNLDRHELATAAIGLLVRRDDQLSYYVENRYIDIIGSNITSLHLDYALNTRYSVALDQAFDFSFGKNVTSGISFARHFDSFSVTVSAYRNDITRQSGFSVSFAPLGLSRGIGSGAFSNSLSR